MNRLALLAVLVVAFACDKGDKGGEKPEGEKVSDTKSGGEAAKAGDSKKAGDGDADDDEPEIADGDEEDGAPDGPDALETQLGFKMGAMKFLGWTEDGTRFAIEATHGADEGEMGGSDLVVLRQVHDTLSGAVIDSYQVKESMDSDVKKKHPHRLAWKQSKPRKEWKTFTSDNTLVGNKAAVKSPDGSWKISPKIVKRTIPLLDKFEVVKRGNRFTSGWTIRTEPETDKERELVVKSKGKDQSKRRPRVSFLLKKGKQKWQSLKYNLPWKRGDLLDIAEIGPGADGSFEAYWSPDGKRLLWIVRQEPVGVNEEAAGADARFYVRAVGAQIKVVDASIGYAEPRRVAAALDEVGLAVSVIEKSEKPSAVSKIYYRGKAAKAVAEKVSARLEDEPAIEEIKKGGWIDVIVFLGGV